MIDSEKHKIKWGGTNPTIMKTKWLQATVRKNKYN